MVFLTYLSACVHYIRLGCWRRLLKCIRHSLWERDNVADPNVTWFLGSKPYFLRTFQVHSSRIWTPVLQCRYRWSRDAKSRGKKCWLLLNGAETTGRAVEGVGLGRSLAGIVGCVLSGRGICIGMIIRPVESYRVWCCWVWTRSPVRGWVEGPHEKKYIYIYTYTEQECERKWVIYKKKVSQEKNE